MHDELLADNQRRACIITAVVLACILSGCERPADAARTHDEATSPPATATTRQSDLTRTFVAGFVAGSEEDIIKALQDGTDFSGEPNLEWFSILLDIWYDREDSHPDFAWSVLKSPRVKVVLGSQCVFRLMPATDSAACRPPIPRHAGRVFRGMSATLSR